MQKASSACKANGSGGSRAQVTLFADTAGVTADVDVFGMGCGWEYLSYTEKPTMVSRLRLARYAIPVSSSSSRCEAIPHNNNDNELGTG